MKTLDEVIELCEKALWCAYLPKDDTTTTAGLALHYLREYREMKEHLACLDAVALHGEDTQIVNNPPLTWDELKQMEGKPVWVEDYFQNDVKTWCIVERIVKDEDCEYVILDGIYFPKDYLGKKIDGWQAYRKERE